MCDVLALHILEVESWWCQHTKWVGFEHAHLAVCDPCIFRVGVWVGPTCKVNVMSSPLACQCYVNFFCSTSHVQQLKKAFIVSAKNRWSSHIPRQGLGGTNL